MHYAMVEFCALYAYVAVSRIIMPSFSLTLVVIRVIRTKRVSWITKNLHFSLLWKPYHPIVEFSVQQPQDLRLHPSFPSISSKFKSFLLSVSTIDPYSLRYPGKAYFSHFQLLSERRGNYFSFLLRDPYVALVIGDIGHVYFFWVI